MITTIDNKTPTDRRTRAVLPNEGTVHLSSSTQYGIRWADGSIDWTTTTTKDNIGITITNLLPQTETGSPDTLGVKQSKSDWDSTLRHKAKVARMPIEEFMDTYTFVKRTVTLSVTAAEEVAR